MSLTVGFDVDGGGGNTLGEMEMGMFVRLARLLNTRNRDDSSSIKLKEV